MRSRFSALTILIGMRASTTTGADACLACRAQAKLTGGLACHSYLALRFERAAEAPGALLHGFAGYFDAELYKDVHLSIFPPTHTPNMFSWFPIYFPLRTPVHVPSVRCSAALGFAARR